MSVLQGFSFHVLSVVLCCLEWHTRVWREGDTSLPGCPATDRDRDRREKKIHIWRFHVFTADSFDSFSSFPLMHPTPTWRWWSQITPVLWKHGNAPTPHKFLSPKASQQLWGAQPQAPRAAPRGQPFTSHPRVMWGTTGWHSQLLQCHTPPTAPPHTTHKWHLEFWTAPLMWEALMEMDRYPPDGWGRFLLPYDSLGGN